METFTLSCWIRGEADVFEIEISTKANMQKVLDLFPLLVPSGADYMDELGNWTMDGKNPLRTLEELSSVFQTRDEDEQWIAIVDYPRHAILGQAIEGYVFDETPMFRDVYATSLQLWRVDLLIDDTVEETIRNLGLNYDDILKPATLLSEIFPELPNCRALHVVVAPAGVKQGPPLHPQHRVSAQRGAFLAQVQPKAPSFIARPSEFYKFQAIDGQTIYCNRPADAVAIIPPTLLHRAFGDFLHDCDVVEPTHEDNSFVMKLQTVMSNHYDDEWKAVQLRELFEGWGLTFMPSMAYHGYMTNWDMREGEYRYAIAQVKNEVGSTQADLYNQATFYYVEFSRQYAEKMALSPLPCFIILLFGPLIMFAGAVWNVRPVIQPLSFVLPLHYHPTDTYMQTTVARHLKAFKNAVVTLEGYYQSLSLNNNPSDSHHSQLFPYPTSFKSLGSNAMEEFEYTSQYPNKLIFFGTLAGERICIKFELCDVDPPPLVFERIRTRLDELHQQGYVHGDEFMFVDFDWAGKIGEVRYPLNHDRDMLKLIIMSFDKGDKCREDDQAQSENVDERESKRPRLTESGVEE
ncbi:hypothetical protein F5J12DRAFT_897672 [Pisolithus orientalis]|uniref:uncharacterized protein n=1 Tax=Pisolithus orientalis TaxID=936130 RepID=UPI0022248E24|nr:uncharacterized protein F5J12DRAFT_897672 [Pisolithus orientalis]KAI5990877.1 hypothetical protein F5J12DRAFT_897672 [Pisolithus orientalis]